MKDQEDNLGRCDTCGHYVPEFELTNGTCADCRSEAAMEIYP